MERRDVERLRADWLKLRGCLFDPATRLPALPAVLDDVRRRLEAGERLGLLYVDLSFGGDAEPACGWQRHDEVVGRVAHELTAFCRAACGREDPVAHCGVRSDDFVVFLAADTAGRLRRLHEQLHETLRGTLREMAVDGEPEPPFESSAERLRPEPTMRIERAIYGAVARAREACRRGAVERRTGRRAALEAMLAADAIVTRFQPIVDLSGEEDGDSSRRRDAGHRYAGHRAVGYEALSAAPTKDVFENTEVLFTFAEETGAARDLERLCRRRAIERAAPLLGDHALLFLNCSAHAFSDPELVRDLVEGTAAVGASPEQIVLEVTERTAITEWRAFRRGLDAARDVGVGVAIDDMGSGYSSLHTVGEIEPDYLKFDFSLVHRLHESPIKRDLLETLATLATKIGARPIAEGIEMDEELRCVTDLGVPLGQGFLFARPAEASLRASAESPRRARSSHGSTA